MEGWKPSKFINYQLTCDHINVVDDDVNGDRVCTDCGLVMDQVYKFHNLEKMEEIKSGPPSPTANDAAKNRFLYNDIIDRMLGKCHVDNKLIRKNIQRDVTTMKKRHKKICEESLVLACIYVNLIKQEVPRPVGDLCNLTNLKEKNVWHYVERSRSFYHPHLMTECFLKPLKLSFKKVQEINRMVQLAETKCVFSPKTLIAACAYLYLRDNNSLQSCSNQLTDKKRCNFTIGRFCKIVNVSPMALQKCINKIGKKYNLTKN